jgi:hypothetical protein
MYGISTGVPWVWAGIGTDYLSYSFRQTTYWSPTRFYSFGPRFEGVFPLFQQWSASIGLNLNRFQEESFDLGNGYYGTAKLQYGEREHLNVAVEYIRILAAQGSSQWISNGVNLSLNAPL